MKSWRAFGMSGQDKPNGSPSVGDTHLLEKEFPAQVTAGGG
jgi:hypothetical protein